MTNNPTVHKKRHVPNNIDDMRDIDWVRLYCGLGVARTLVDLYPGVRLYIPKRLKPNHELIKTLGETLALQLSFHFSGDMLSIPRSLDQAQTRQQRIICLHGKKQSIRAIALDVGCSERWVHEVLKQRNDKAKKDMPPVPPRPPEKIRRYRKREEKG